ncbi:MAG: VPLPA-CTERM sorting domain-containing protein [Paracoccaceae bacterium]
MRNALVSAVLATAISTAAGAAPFQVFTDRAAWEAAVGGATITEDGFDNDIADADSITFDSGVVSTNSGGTRFLVDNMIDDGIYENAVDGDGAQASLLITWTFPEAIFAFGADWDDTTNAGILTVTGNFDGMGDETVNFGSVLGDPGEGFLGIVGMGDFTQIAFGTALATEGEIFDADNLVFAAAPDGVIPLPAGLVLMLTGLGAFGALRATRR